MSSHKLTLLWLSCIVVATTLPTTAQRRISEDRDLIEIDLTGWDCLDKMEGSAKSADGADRNRGKNRSATDLSRLSIPSFDTATFLKHVAAFDAETKGKRRKDLSAPQQAQLAALEKQVVSLTGYLVIAYAGPPESTNCGSVDFHDWHLEIFEKPADHSPRIGDPTPIVCEITPRLQTALFRDNIRLLELAAFMRRPDLTVEPTGHTARRIRLTGYLLWDDDHNGKADIGPTIEAVRNNGYHNPWRSTPWEIHPVLKIEALDSSATAAVPTKPPSVAASTSGVAAAPASITILEPVKIKIPYGETTLPRGMKLEVIARDAQSATVRYLDGEVKVPLHVTDLR